MRKYFLLFLLYGLNFNYLYTQEDNSLVFMDMLLELNQNIHHDQNTYLIANQDMPVKLDSVKKIEQSVFLNRYTLDAVFDTIFTYKGVDYGLNQSYNSVISYVNNEDAHSDLTIIDSTLSSHLNVINIGYYKEDTVVGMQKDKQKRMDLDYYDSGQLARIQQGDALFISSLKLGKDSIKYIVDMIAVLPEEVRKMVGSSLPNIEMLVTKINESECYKYENFFRATTTSDPIINKTIVQCVDGKFKEELILDRYSNYKEKYRDFEFVYNDQGFLVAKTSKKDVPYAKEWNYTYEYNNGKLISDKRFAEEIIYEYDSRGNVVLQLTKNRINGKIDRLVSRKITYE